VTTAAVRPFGHLPSIALRVLDRQIDLSERLERVLSRDVEQTVERGLERGLGIQL
jgi:hypothetical protein